ncbi:Outer membrane protein assembly factor BamA [Planctomycetes bacterium CA13]|uniref:Outer membrane protein assembly factor BamA n=1 Tax=Novipirellula herctigrandis TaxID=2527986 RepID=A0A5C5Z7R6_9BACT|nr:Outer membrane protein assembly factor BamA [Planctomycetes bacterium CA13]
MLALNQWLAATVLCWGSCNVILADESAAPKSPAGVVFFSGNETYSDAQLREALNRDADFLIASHPMGDRNLTGSVTEKRLTAGYRNEGFRDISVQGNDDVANLAWTFVITEGKQFTCGDVQIRGDLPVHVPDLVDRLTKPFPADDTFPSFVEINGKLQTRWVDENGKEKDLEKPVWKIGDPVPFDSNETLQAACRKAIAGLGYSDAMIFVTISSDSDTQTGTLVIDVAEAGKPNQANQIVIQGNEINSRESILEFVNLDEGDAVDQQTIQSVTRQLWESGRFATHRVKFDRVQNGTLTIHLDEIKGCPSLDTPLDQRAKAFLLAGQWVSRSIEAGGDLELSQTAGPHAARLIQSDKGLYIEWDVKAASDPNHQVELFRILVDSDVVVIDHTSHKKQMRFSPIRAGGCLKYGVKVAASHDPTQHGRLNFDWAIRSTRDENDSPLQYVSSYGSADWLPFAYKAKSRFEVADHHLIAKTEGSTMEIDMDAGELVRWTSESGAVRFRTGAFDAARQALLGDTASKPNAFDANEPMTSVASYLLSEPIMNRLVEASAMQDDPAKSIDPVLVSALRKMIDGGLLSLGDAFILAEYDRDPANDFEIPSNRIAPKAWKQMALEFAGRTLLRYSPDLFAEDTWPMQLCRQTAFVAMGSTEHTKDVLDQLLRNPDHGPLCHACVSSLVRYINEDASKTFARRALDTFTPEAFQNDYRSLTSAVSGKVATQTLTCLHALTQSELDQLKACFGNESSQVGLQMLYDFSRNHPNNEALFWYQIAEAPLRKAMERTLSR